MDGSLVKSLNSGATIGGYHNASQRDCGTRPEVANTLFLMVLCHYHWFWVELPHKVESAAELP